MRRFRSPTFGLMTLLALVAAALLAGYSPAAAQDNPPAVEDNMRTLSVWAVGTASGSPDIAYAEMGVEIRSEQIGDALTQANATMQAVTDALTGFGIAATDIQTTQFNVYQEGQPMPMPGAEGEAALPPPQYVVTNIVRVTVRDINQVSDAIQTALDAGANRVYGLTFGLADQDMLRSQARQEAAQRAAVQALELAQAFNVQLGEPVRIDESTQGGPLVAESLAFGRGGGGPPLSAGELTVTVQLYVTYRVTP